MVGKRTVLAYAKEKAPPSLQQSGPEKSFREVKRKSIIAGLRVLKAPAVTRHDWWAQLGQVKGQNKGYNYQVSYI